MQKGCDSAERERVPSCWEEALQNSASPEEFQKDAQGPPRSSQSPGPAFLKSRKHYNTAMGNSGAEGHSSNTGCFFLKFKLR